MAKVLRRVAHGLVERRWTRPVRPVRFPKSLPSHRLPWTLYGEATDERVAFFRLMMLSVDMSLEVLASAFDGIDLASLLGLCHSAFQRKSFFLDLFSVARSACLALFHFCFARTGLFFTASQNGQHTLCLVGFASLLS